jgi:peptidoglycan/xylan/chitin deacetylase (PgdA/CDA1 family)
MVAAKHHIGNHSYSHRDLSKLSEEEVREEITRCDEVIKEYVGDGKKRLRCPYGGRNADVERIIAELGHTHVLGNAETRDWDPEFQPDKWAQLGLQRIRAKSNPVVVVAHDRQKTTAQNVDTFIEQISALGNI